MRKALATVMVMVVLLGGCAASEASEPEPGATYDNECRVRVYGEGLSMEEYNTFPEKVTDRIVEQDMTMDEALEDLGVPYYEECKISGGE